MHVCSCLLHTCPCKRTHVLEVPRREPLCVGKLPLREAVEFKPLIPHLAFITNKKQWSGHIRGQAMRTIPEEDHAYIMNAAKTPGD